MTYGFPKKANRTLEMHIGFNENRCKVLLKLSLNRLKLAHHKKVALNMNQRREIAELISQGKIDSAMIRVEHVIRDDYFQEALEMLSLYVDTLLARFGLLSHKQLDAGISEPVYAIVFAAPRVNIKELEDIKHQFQHKYGRELIDNANNNPDIFVNPKVICELI